MGFGEVFWDSEIEVETFSEMALDEASSVEAFVLVGTFEDAELGVDSEDFETGVAWVDSVLPSAVCEITSSLELEEAEEDSAELELGVAADDDPELGVAEVS